MFDILQIIPTQKKKTTQSGWHSFNAVCCHHRGHNPDRKGRGGVKFSDPLTWRYHCFNCGFSCGFTLGKSITRSTKQFLLYCGADIEQIERWNFESIQQRDLLDFTQPYHQVKKIKFKESALPEGELIDIDNSAHGIFVEYLAKRKIDASDYPFLCTPAEYGRQARRIIIPFTHKNKIVGHTSRYIDDRWPKYITESQEGYLFGLDLQKPEHQVCIVMEGIFDALSIGGCALTKNTISELQISQLRQLNKRIIVVPDQDKTGLELCDKALELGFSVSLPQWESGVKDVNDSVIKYGKLSTVLSILQSATTSKIKTEIRRKQIDKRL